MLKFIKKINLTLLIILALCAGFSAVCAKDAGTFVTNQDFVLEDGETLEDDLFLFGGNAELQEGSVVDGSVLIFGGNAVIDGTVNGDVTAFGGSVRIGPVAVVNGDMTCLDGDLVQADSSVINGDRLTRWTTGEDSYGAVSSYAGSLGNAASHILISLTSFSVMSIRVLLFMLLALLVCALMPKQLKRNSRKLSELPWQSLLIGFLCVVFFALIEIALCITLILIPLALGLLVVFWLFCLYGLVVVSYWLGTLLTEWLKLNWSAVGQTIIGALALRVITFALVRLVPCLGGSVELVAEMFGIGAVVLTLTNWFNHQKTVKAVNESETRTDPSAPVEDPLEGDDPVEGVKPEKE